ncbi:MAG: LacI family transcriptional regulator [Firmicutes bacterium]|nr:LacI family transcriptional regulator [Bacillota bacterium]
MKSTNKRATIRDIAQLAKTSVATVSWVINGDSRKYVSDELKERVQQAAKILNYHPNLLAQRLKGKSRKLLAIIIPQFENIFFNRIVIGAEKYANSRGYKLLICTTDDDFRKEAEIINQLIANWVDGFLITPTLEGKKSVDAIVQSGVPLVLMECVSKADIDCVAVDNFNTASLAAEFLFQRGHRQIAYIGWDTGFESILNRSKGFIQGLNELGIPREEIIFMKCLRSAEAGYIITNEILNNHKPTVFFIDQNNIAEGVVRALRERKLNIPGDISLLLYGDPSWARLNVPEFTAMNLPDFDIGAEAARILIDKLEGRDTAIQKILLSGHLAIRDSVINHSPANIVEDKIGEIVNNIEA